MKLSLCKILDNIKKRLKIKEEFYTIELIINLYKTNIEALSNIFITITLNKDTFQIHYYINIIDNLIPSKKRKVQSLIQETLKGL